MVSCPRCGSGQVESDLAADARIYLSFWACSACGQHGVSRVIDRHPPADSIALSAAPASRAPLRGHLPGRALRRPLREGRSRA